MSEPFAQTYKVAVFGQRTFMTEITVVANTPEEAQAAALRNAAKEGWVWTDEDGKPHTGPVSDIYVAGMKLEE
jgi:hypothetical protein